MTLWVARYGVRMLSILLAMLLVEFAAFFFAHENNINRLLWVPVNYLLVAYAGYDTVRRMPLLWGVVVSGAMAGIVNSVSWLIGSFVVEGRFRMPAEAEPLLFATSLLMASVIGAIIGGAAGVIARTRRRQRARRSAIRKLSYTAMDDVPDVPDVMTERVGLPPAPRLDESRNHTADRP